MSGEMSGYCTYGSCSNPTTYVVVTEGQKTTLESFCCGKHLAQAVQLATEDGDRAVVVHVQNSHKARSRS